MNQWDIRIIRIYTEKIAPPPIVTDDSVQAGLAGYQLSIEWEAGTQVNAANPALTLNVATRDIITNNMVGNLTFNLVSPAIQTDSIAHDRMYKQVRAIGVADLTANHMYEVSACLVNAAMEICSYVHSWVFVAF